VFSVANIEPTTDELSHTFAIELKSLEERLDTDAGVCIDIDKLSGCLTEYWLVFPKSLKVLLKPCSSSSSQMVSDWLMMNGDSPDEFEELELASDMESFSVTVLDFGDVLRLTGALLQEEETPEDSVVELLLNETIEEVHEFISWEFSSCSEIFLSIRSAELRALWPRFSFSSMSIKSAESYALFRSFSSSAICLDLASVASCW